jgi:glycosyltransferase involved in cell wall biosynthesis
MLGTQALDEMNHVATTERPLLTIAIPTFNRCGFLGQLLASLGEQTRGEERVEVLVSDNASADETAAVVERARGLGLRLTYVRNAENVGADGNFLQCYERAAGKYVWIFSDDDLLRPGAVGLILDELSRDEYELVYVSSAGFSGEAKLVPARSALRPRVCADPADFVRRVHIFTTMISGNIINKDRVEEIGHEPFAKLLGSQLIQLGWTFTALRGHRKSLYVEEELVAYRLGNTGGYGVCRVFGPVLSSVAEDWLGVPRLSRLIVNASLQRLLPGCLSAARGERPGAYLREDPHAVLSSRFANNFRYWLFDYPLIVLPSGLGWIWLQALRVFNRIDRACGYPSLSW